MKTTWMILGGLVSGVACVPTVPEGAVPPAEIEQDERDIEEPDLPLALDLDRGSESLRVTQERVERDPDPYEDDESADSAAGDVGGYPEQDETQEEDTPPGDLICVYAQARSGQIALVERDLALGTEVELGRYGSATASFHASGLAHIGTEWVFAHSDGSGFVWHKIDTAVGTLVRARASGSVRGVAESGSDWVTLDSFSKDRVHGYTSFSELSASRPGWSDPIPRMAVSRLTMHGTTVIAAWHSTDEVELVDLATGAASTLALSSWDTWVHGMDVVDGDLILMDDGRGPHTRPGMVRVGRFDLTTGALIDEYFIPRGRGGTYRTYGFPSGLWCHESSSAEDPGGD